ncbi:glycoside hydrolase family 43 protein [Halorhabdus amylolytica]|uniref:glycoside hydrolase family 43 protein n=1 Tax=Halorhabdus amylolytica TaxID=2559573 RepID=UPI0010AAAA76|nr:glycoside hydrolase family 43 protein [Halorhabdus amylolytica]
MPYRNPIIPGFNPDPTVCRVGSEYYLATSSFEYFPGLPLYRSRDLVEWEPIGHALDRTDQINLSGRPSSRGIFAPTLRYQDGTFYLTTTDVEGEGHFILTTDDPAGSWSDPTFVDAPGFDPDLFFGDEVVYFTYKAEQGINQAPIELATGDLGTTRTVWEGVEDPLPEAPHIYKIDGQYYLLAAEGGTHFGHMIVAGRSDSPTGPFEPHPENPILSHRAKVPENIHATGHGDLVQAHDGSWWIVFLAVRMTGRWPRHHHLGRETYLAPVSWKNRWPVINDGKPIGIEMDAVPPDPDPDAPPIDGDSVTAGHETFDGALGPAWNYRRTPAPDHIESVDGLQIDLVPETLSKGCPTFVGRRQQHFVYTIRTRLDFDPDRAVEEAGIAVLMNERHHYDLGVRGGENQQAFLRRQLGDYSSVVETEPIETDSVILTINADEVAYHFEIEPVAETGNRVNLGSAETRYLSTETAGGFTGVYIGPYATCNGDESDRTARFAWFEYKPTDEEGFEGEWDI